MDGQVEINMVILQATLGQSSLELVVAQSRNAILQEKVKQLEAALAESQNPKIKKEKT